MHVCWVDHCLVRSDVYVLVWFTNFTTWPHFSEWPTVKFPSETHIPLTIYMWRSTVLLQWSSHWHSFSRTMKMANVSLKRITMCFNPRPTPESCIPHGGSFGKWDSLYRHAYTPVFRCTGLHNLSVLAAPKLKALGTYHGTPLPPVMPITPLWSLAGSLHYGHSFYLASPSIEYINLRRV